ncbi:hypothetical protein D8I24_8125 [Cupriavidus necator H850]|nr:hypothetical protein D8I24_8125 [Cupriavidus necator H850]
MPRESRPDGRFWHDANSMPAERRFARPHAGGGYRQRGLCYMGHCRNFRRSADVR